MNNQDKLKSYCRDILSGLAHVHSKGLIHADMKVENVLTCAPLDESSDVFPVMKLCDFGLSQRLDKDGRLELSKKIGTIGYMAPELGTTEFVDQAIDMWSVGIMFYEMTVAYKPTAVKGYKYGSGPIPFAPADWRRKSKALQNLI